MDKDAITVELLNNRVKNLLTNSGYFDRIRVIGEISNYKSHHTGHAYFVLKDKNAEISVVMFKGYASHYLDLIENGKQVIITGKIDVYVQGGRYQLNAFKIEEDGEGRLFRKFEELKKRLEKEGLFNVDIKKAIPKYCFNIGIVTASQGAAIQDMKKIAMSRNPHVKLYFYSSLVQGKYACDDIIEGIEYLDKMNLDVIVIGRGGGSIEDLWAFNEEKLAYAIYKAKTPIVSAVGHETDTTISDYVADKRVSTPSHAMEMVVTPYTEMLQTIHTYKNKLIECMEYGINTNKLKLNELEKILAKCNVETTINDSKNNITKIKNEMTEILASKIQNKKDDLVEFKELDIIFERKLNAIKIKNSSFIDKLKGLSPLNRLEEGYLFAIHGDKRIKSTKNIKVGDKISLYSREEKLIASIEAKEKFEVR